MITNTHTYTWKESLLCAFPPSAFLTYMRYLPGKVSSFKHQLICIPPAAFCKSSPAPCVPGRGFVTPCDSYMFFFLRTLHNTWQNNSVCLEWWALRVDCTTQENLQKINKRTYFFKRKTWKQTKWILKVIEMRRMKYVWQCVHILNSQIKETRWYVLLYWQVVWCAILSNLA